MQSIFIYALLEVISGKQTMAPTPKACPVDDCEYTTPTALPNYELVYKDMNMHLEYTHTVASGGGGNRQGGGSETSRPRPDKLPRPEIGEGATEADWEYFSDRWHRYKRSTALENQTAVDQLWACCTTELSRSVYDSGMRSTSTESELQVNKSSKEALDIIRCQGSASGLG